MADNGSIASALGLSAFVFTGYSLLNSNADFRAVLSSEPDDTAALAQLRMAELASGSLIVVVGGIGSVLARSWLPLVLAVITVAAGIVAFEGAFAVSPKEGNLHVAGKPILEVGARLSVDPILYRPVSQGTH